MATKNSIGDKRRGLDYAEAFVGNETIRKMFQEFRALPPISQRTAIDAIAECEDVDIQRLVGVLRQEYVVRAPDRAPEYNAGGSGESGRRARSSG